ncbi:glycosyltransferase family 4 protein [Belliella sp. R4-6]|uniref:Glycosyltransferase family 4 protein n=1 Tax=Belliella alkalica TaxID=1730871 RepID=A0ABS9V7J3_9BACT|nr:glycosyltransferase family 4 protein [Belliella alkalica]MCH7412391.1 glycosyltransferase family 4 protein [Belliella alkalica]
MKIIFSNPYLSLPSRSAEAVFLMKMAESYGKLGHDLTLFLLDNGNSLNLKELCEHFAVEEVFRIEGFKLSNQSKVLFFQLAFMIPYNYYLKKPDLFHAKHITPAWGAVRFFGISTVLELHDTPTKNRKTFMLFKNLVKSKSLRFLICITHALANHVRQFVPDNLNILVIPDGVNRAALEFDLSKEKAKSQLGINTNKPIVLYTGQLYKGRGIGLIIELAKRLSDFYFVLVGGNPNDIIKFKECAVLLSNISFEGFKSQSELLIYQKSANFLLMPYADKVSVSGDKGGDTAQFASPMKMFEYMATGRPIISSTLPVLSEILEDDYNALMVPYNDVDGWVKALELLKNNPAIGERLANQAKDDVKQYTWEKRAEKIIDFYNSIDEKK